MSIQFSGGAVKPTAFKWPTKARRAARRAKALAPWAGLVWEVTECGLAAMDKAAEMDTSKLLADDPDLGGDLTDEEIRALPEGALDELRALEASALADDMAWVLEHYRVAPDGDHLRFQGHAPGDFARVSVPVPGEKTLVWRSGLACMPEAAFAGAAAAWAKKQGKGAGEGH